VAGKEEEEVQDAVDAGFGSALAEWRMRKGGDESEGGAWGGMDSS